jgi:hypothetical protein
VRGLTDDLYITLPFFFRILRVTEGPMSMAAPKSLPGWIFDTGNLATVSRNLTHSYQSYSTMVEISTVSPLTLLSGTWIYRPKISREVCDLTYASLIMQSSQNRLGQPYHSMCRPTPFLNSRTPPPPMLEDCVWGSVCLIWQPASHNLLLNSPSTCALDQSTTMTLGTPSL